MKIGRIIGSSVTGVILLSVALAYLAERGAPSEADSPGASSSVSVPSRCSGPACASNGVGTEYASRLKYIGVSSPHLTNVHRFVRTVRAQPNLISFYVPFGDPFESEVAARVVRMHALPLMQIDPSRTSVRAIANGRYRAYLASYARQVKVFRDTVAIGFGHEMNGPWYSWGHRRTPPRVFVRAWRVIHNAFKAAHVRNVIWVWTIDRYSPVYSVPLRKDWPGAAYVDWVGIDGYYRGPSARFNTIFNSTLRIVRRITHDPVLITETAAADRRTPQQIRDLFAGVRRAHLLGMIWFDINARQHWQLEGRPRAVTAFRRGLRSIRYRNKG